MAGTSYVVEGNRTGASDGPPKVRPARMARVSSRHSGAPPASSVVVSSGRVSSSMRALHLGQEVPDDPRQLVGLDEEGIVPVRAPQFGVTGVDALGLRQLHDLARLVR